tara:strand:+ start:1671 stop:1775 length:105 start_codon:yes stop_codon:yes gene_type:complete
MVYTTIILQIMLKKSKGKKKEQIIKFIEKQINDN